MSDQTQQREAMIARIRALMNKTVANGCTEEEAKAAAAAVDRLLEVYELTLDEISVEEQEVIQLDIAVAHHHVRFAAMEIARFTDCRVWLSKPNIAYLGLDLDTRIAEYLTLVFKRAIDRETTSYTMFNADYAMSDRRGQDEMMHTFAVGMATRLGERLHELKSKRDFAVKSSGRDLVVIKGPMLDEAMQTLGIIIGRGRAGRSIRDGKAFVAGRNAAEAVAISQGVGNYSQKTGSIR